MIGLIITKKDSKRFKNKHIKKINGRSVISYTIECALKSKIEKLLVVTDDDKIIRIAENYNNNKIKIIKLSKELNNIGSINTIIYATKDYGDNDKIILLQATSPLRNVKDINKCYFLMMNENIDFITSVYKIRSCIIENGAIFCAKLGKLREIKNWYSDKTFFYLMPEERSVDIDYDYQFDIAETLLKNKKKYKKIDKKCIK
jgi:CMP-N,N'-diacetyllegionaminic acid synthase